MFVNQSETRTRIGTAIKEARIKKGLTQRQLGEILGKSNNTITTWEKGNNSPDVNDIELLCGILDIPVNSLFPPKDLLPKEEINNIIDILHKRPEIKRLFDVSVKASKEDIENAIRIIEALKNK